MPQTLKTDSWVVCMAAWCSSRTRSCRNLYFPIPNKARGQKQHHVSLRPNNVLQCTSNLPRPMKTQSGHYTRYQKHAPLESSAWGISWKLRARYFLSERVSKLQYKRHPDRSQNLSTWTILSAPEARFSRASRKKARDSKKGAPQVSSDKMVVPSCLHTAAQSKVFTKSSSVKASSRAASTWNCVCWKTKRGQQQMVPNMDTRNCV